MDVTCATYGREQKFIVFWSGNSIGGWILKSVFKNYDEMVQTGFFLLRKGTSDSLL